MQSGYEKSLVAKSGALRTSVFYLGYIETKKTEFFFFVGRLCPREFRLSRRYDVEYGECGHVCTCVDHYREFPKGNDADDKVAGHAFLYRSRERVSTEFRQSPETIRYAFSVRRSFRWAGTRGRKRHLPPIRPETTRKHLSYGLFSFFRFVFRLIFVVVFRP